MALVRARFFTAAYCALAASDPNGGGGSRRTSSALASTHGFHIPASGATGVALLQTPGVGGNESVKVRFEWSVCANAMTCFATFWPMLRPAAASLGNATPALTREVAASFAIAVSF